jgi:hypothetical protein
MTVAGIAKATGQILCFFTMFPIEALPIASCVG